MTVFLLRRLGSSAVLIFAVLTLTFFMIQWAPGGLSGVYLDSRVPAEYEEELRALYGFDRPAHEQYVSWLKAIAFDWNWGVSPAAKRPVSELLALYAPPTLQLGAAALFVQFTLGMLLGVTSARHAGEPLDQAIRIGSVVLYAVPAFWLGLVAILLFSHAIPIFPPGHSHGLHAEGLGIMARTVDRLRHLALPALVLGLSTLGSVVRLLRGRLVEVLEQDYVRTARAKGVTERRVLWIHALRNAAAPLTQLFGLSLPLLVGGAVVVEKVFAWPGMGRLVWEAIGTRDYPVLLAVTALAAVFVVIGSLVDDLLLAAIDPRVRHEE